LLFRIKLHFTMSRDLKIEVKNEKIFCNYFI
jgi:hypothetical protein